MLGVKMGVGLVDGGQLYNLKNTCSAKWHDYTTIIKLSTSGETHIYGRKLYSA